MEKVIALKYVADIPGVCVAIDTAIERDIIVRPDSGKFTLLRNVIKVFIILYVRTGILREGSTTRFHTI